jgi:hypothetical protein
MLYCSIATFWRRGRLSGASALTAVTLLLAGCMTGRTVLAIDTRTVQKASFEMVDQRPGDERTTKWLSNVPYSCAFTVRQYGDEAISPDRFTLLRAGLDTGLHERLAGKTLLVTHFGIYINSAQRSRAAEIIHGEGLAQSLTDTAMADRFERLCAAEELAEGWLEAGHKDMTHSVAIVRVTFILEGRVHSVRVLENVASPGTAAAIASAVGKASERIIAELRTEPSVIGAGGGLT